MPISEVRPKALALVATTILLYGCSSPYEVRLSDERSASNGALFFFGWADPPLIPGTRLVDAPPGSRVVLWNEAGLEAIVDVADPCLVIVREGDGARAPTDVELAVLAEVFRDWPLAASHRPREYLEEKRLERRFPSHVRAHASSLEPDDLVAFSLGDAPAGWFALGGRVFALSLAAKKAPASALSRLIERASTLAGEDRRQVMQAIAARSEVTVADLVKIARVEPDLAVAHASATPEVCFAAIERVSKEALSSARRKGLERILESPAATPEVRRRVLEVPLAYPEDRDHIRRKSGTADGER